MLCINPKMSFEILVMLRPKKKQELKPATKKTDTNPENDFVEYEYSSEGSMNGHIASHSNPITNTYPNTYPNAYSNVFPSNSSSQGTGAIGTGMMNEEDEPPLLEGKGCVGEQKQKKKKKRLGINFHNIWEKTLYVLIPRKNLDEQNIGRRGFGRTDYILFYLRLFDAVGVYTTFSVVIYFFNLIGKKNKNKKINQQLKQGPKIKLWLYLWF
ncbi:hypothetical protein RFI_22306 [Reticulomyxa filosa]|uniref:Uncharacterized protein n=1 Tax=Reticulomyxa filosa TaxID=46433 RepID=X6MPN9_RETFI|nr:hypothetical protein RFI_22306 [Reticulomyxa filosa]|eukprot:ETO15060.1 hypothetical protein RFI_22306 [Reticulomyxa filosa]